MRILMMTNTYTPVVGGVEESIRAFTEQFRQKGHDVCIVAPEFEHQPKNETGVIRIPAIQRFNRSDFSVNLPIPGLLSKLVHDFKPDIVHSHHPFLIGDMALRLCGQYNISLVFTYHTMFEDYLHYLPIQNHRIKSFVIELSTGYANLTDHVIVPSQSVYDILLKRGVEVPMSVIPTGVDMNRFSKGNGDGFRQRYGIPVDAFVVGHLGRLTPEKNLQFLSEAVSRFVRHNSNVHFLIIGKGPLDKEIQNIFQRNGVGGHCHMTGVLTGQDVVDAYHAMSVFAFASQTETQGLVLNEAMASGLPIVAVDATGVRDMVQDAKSGRLIQKQDTQEFINALLWCYNRSQREFEQLKDAARAKASEYSIGACAERELSIYKSLQSQDFVMSGDKHDVWSNVMRRIKTEWDMAKNFVEASEAAFSNGGTEQKQVREAETSLLDERHKQSRRLKWKRWFDAHEWSARLLSLKQSNATEVHPGLVMIQIDGFSKNQMTRALDEGRMPFLSRLITQQHYKIYPLYTGLPSSTPSVQGELFYGVKQIVPAFAFFDHTFKKVFRMYDREGALEVQKKLDKERFGLQGLLAGGSSYSNVYSGGADETHFCAVKIGWDMFWRGVNPFKLILLFITHLYGFARIAVLMVLETVLAFFDFIHGIILGENIIKELKFIPTRTFICILLRELIMLGARLDISRGLPIIHMNFLGYDEQAHRRGPSSLFARKALPGIDQAIAKIYAQAIHATRRNYDVWIYSDHGQEDCLSYVNQYGETVKEAVTRIYQEFTKQKEIMRSIRKNPNRDVNRHGVESQRMRYLGDLFIRALFAVIGLDYSKEEESGDQIVVTAIGPTGNIYLPKKLNEEDRHQFALKLVHEAQIPVVLAPLAPGHVFGWTRSGTFCLPEEAKKIIGADHMYLEEITNDLIALCHHSEGGDFTFLGWDPDGKPLTFPVENGAHAGPGREETNAFALLPSDIISTLDEPAFLRTKDLRHAALTLLGRVKEAEKIPSVLSVKQIEKNVPAGADTLRIMTYNVHSCIGMDGKISAERIARVIARHSPDIVALQELDLMRLRTGGLDQPHIIAQELEMIYHFHPNIILEEEHYGNAILSRYPMVLVKADKLPGLNHKPNLEPRGAMWCVVRMNGKNIQIINTHFGLRPKERFLQAEEICSPNWLGHSDCEGPIILCGDFNALPGSSIYNGIRNKLHDVQVGLADHAPRPTWFSHFPVGRIDHVFISSGITVKNIIVPQTDLDKKSSDHLPLIVDIQLPEQ